MKKFIFWLYLTTTKERNSDIYCHKSGKFYGIYYSDLKRWVIKDGDYCELQAPTKTDKQTEV